MMYSKKGLFLLLSIISLILISLVTYNSFEEKSVTGAFAANIQSTPGNIASCQVLDVGGVYTLTQNVTPNANSNASCFNITGNNIEINCQGFNINYSIEGTGGRGVNTANLSGLTNITIKNCDITEGNSTAETGLWGRHAIYLFNVTNSTIWNNTIVTIERGSAGIYINESRSNNNVSNNRINITGDHDAPGIALTNRETGSNNDTINSNEITTIGLQSVGGVSDNYGIYVYGNGVFFSNINIIDNNVSINASPVQNSGIYLRNSIQNSLIFNNTVNTSSSGTNYGIFCQESCFSNNITSNRITTSSNGIALSTGASQNIINYNNITLNAGDNGIYYVTGTGSGNNITHNIITIIGSVSRGIYVQAPENIDLLTAISNNTINGKEATGVNNYGIELYAAGNVILKENNISIGNAGSEYGVFLNEVNGDIIIDQNTITTTGSSSSNLGIYIFSAAVTTNPKSNITSNIISTNGTSGDYGIYLQSSVNNTFIFNNTITTNGTSTSNFGIFLDSVYENIITNNTITSQGAGNDYGIRITGASQNNIFLNNTITSLSGLIISDENSTTNNTLLYENSFGQINWTKSNLTTNITLKLNTTIYLQNNSIGLVDDPQAFNLNGSASIAFYNLSYTQAPQLLKSGVRCDTTELCNSTYNATSGILTINVSSFSNYTTQESVPPVVVTSSAGSITRTSAVLQAVTDENATCKYDAGNKDYSEMAATMDGSGGTTHSTTVSGLNEGTDYVYYVRCEDTLNNIQTSSAIISFTTTKSGGGSSSGGGSGSSSQTTTEEPAESSTQEEPTLETYTDPQEIEQNLEIHIQQASTEEISQLPTALTGQAVRFVAEDNFVPPELETMNIVFENKGAKAMNLSLQIEEKLGVLPNEDKVRELLRGELSEEQAEERVETFKRLERENARLILQKILEGCHKENQPVNTISGIVPTCEHIMGDLLKTKILGADGEIIIGPGQRIEKEIVLQKGFSATPQNAEVVFYSNNQQVAQQTFTPTGAVINTGIDIDSSLQLLDIYVVLPSQKDDTPFYVELLIDKENSTLYSELFGPYHVTDLEGNLLTLQLKYNSKMYNGIHTITSRVHQGDEMVHQRSFSVEMGEEKSSSRQLTSLWLLLPLGIFIILMVLLNLHKKHLKE